MSVTSDEESIKNDDYYLWIRSQIEHEDGLINNRMTWLLTLQAFLFGAYGFSISARSNLAAAYIQQHKDVKLNDSDMLYLTTAFVSDARTGLGIMACCSSMALLIGIAAAANSMEKLVESWEAKPSEMRNRFPQIIGKPSEHSGIYFGLIPTYLLPILSAFVWAFLVKTWQVYCAFSMVLVTAAGALIYLSRARRVRLLARRNNSSPN